MNQVMDKLKQYPIVVVSVVVILVCAVSAFLRGSVVEELTRSEDDLTKRILTINTNSKNSKDLEQDVEAVVASVAVIEERLFDREERSINTDFFYSFEDRLDVLISDVSQLTTEDASLIKGGPNELKLYSGVSYNVKVSGSFQAILKFLYEIHRMEALMRVATFDVVEGESEGLLSANLRVVVLAQKE